ncbi:hypothetical protein IQ265_28435 [Nodosilinea sp. LEGE 06152]|uniref:hypothetical protein n=1 Tax=Nodosilinea sp. LEGE 06152 TaxID=2777966 RepID=UPI00187EE7D0|nr:hypothetical protein [Nodosilinea sp. LEGE 06152]MBE9160721.1 hypothetical protein [Nodosilinea sp. LEGE 06152]
MNKGLITLIFVLGTMVAVVPLAASHSNSKAYTKSNHECTEDKDSRAAATEQISTPGQEDIVVIQGSANQMLTSRAVSQIPPQALERIRELSQSHNGIINSRSRVLQQIGDEAIYESSAIEVQTITPDGIVSCDVTDTFIDEIVNEADNLIFIGGPQDNQ